MVAFMPEPQTLLMVVAPFERRADHVRSELVGRERGEFPHETAERGAGGGQDDDGIGAGCHDGSPFNADSIGLQSSYDAAQKMQPGPGMRKCRVRMI
jgi:hypothetical protein